MNVIVDGFQKKTMQRIAAMVAGPDESACRGHEIAPAETTASRPEAA
jgi:hypothetical protein